MAKDFTFRGGKRVRSGPKATPASEKIASGKPVSVMNNNLPDQLITELKSDTVLEGHEMPEPSAYLSAKQVDGSTFEADKIYKELWSWLQQRQCENLVNRRLLEACAEYFARYIQCEEAISKYGLLGQHPTTGAAVASPYVAMSQSYHKQANIIFSQIMDIVKTNCTESYSEESENIMEKILNAKR